MADVLSFAASIIAVLGAAEGVAKTLSRIRSIRNAPDELLALTNEVSDLQIILSDVQGYVRTTQAPQISQEHLQHLSKFVNRAKEKLLQLDELVHYKVLKPQSSPDKIKVSKREWLMAVKTIDKFRQSLRDIRLNIVTHMMMINSTYQSRIALTIDEIRLISDRTQANQQTSNDSMHLQLDEQTRLLTTILHGQANVQGLLRLQQLSDKPSQSPPVDSGLPTGNEILRPVIYIRAHAYHDSQYPCDSYCKCTCHLKQTFESPAVLHKAIGTLFLGYSGYPLRAFQRCTEASCVSQSTFQAHVQYLFPSWFLVKALTITVMSASIGVIKAALVVRRIVPGGAEIFRLTKLNDVESIKNLLRSGLASPNDSNPNGQTVLAIAVRFYRFEACDVLLRAGADPYLTEFKDNISPFAIAWNLIFQGFLDYTSSQRLRDMFPDGKNLIDDRGFSNLHRAILKLEHGDLNQQIKTYKSMINDIDVNGYTALIWASRRGDQDAINILVEAGADVNIQNNSGFSALHYAAEFCTLESVKVLLKAGSDIHQVGQWGDSVLHCAARSMLTVERIISHLVGVGADPNAINFTGESSLPFCTFSKNAEAAKALLDNGADINRLDNDGDSALLQSLFYGADNVTQILLSRGAIYTSWDSMGNSILHVAALSGSLKTLDILRDAKLQDVDPDAGSRQGQTALQLAQARLSNPEGFVEKLQELLMDIRIRNTELRRARASEHKEAQDHQKLHFLGMLQSLLSRTQARLAHRMQVIRHTITPRNKDFLQKWVRIAVVLALVYFGLSYICRVLGLSRAVQGLVDVWYMLGPGDFVDL